MPLEKEQFEKMLEGKSDDEKKILTSLFEESQKNHSLKSEAFKERDELKAKLREFEESKQKAEEENRKKQGEYKELYEKSSAELSEKNKQIEELLGIKTKYQSVETERRKELIERLPEGKLRETAIKITDIELLKEHVDAVLETIGDDKGGSFSGRGGGQVIPEGATWDDLTNEQREHLKKNNKKKYDLLLKKKFGR